MKVIGYVRLSKNDGNSASLDSQREIVAQWCRANDHELLTVIAEVASAKDYHKLHGRRLAIAALICGMADAIVVRDLDRVTRSTADGGALLEDAKVNDWRLVGVVDHLDTSDEEQEFTINMRIALAQEERRKISRRTKQGLATVARQRKADGKDPLGKPRQVKPELEARIVRLAKKGNSAYRIAQQLTAQNVPTPQGKSATWSPSVVRDVITRNAKTTRNGGAS